MVSKDNGKEQFFDQQFSSIIAKDGYMGAILQVDLSTGIMVREPFTKKLASKWLGGRGLGGYLVYNSIKPDTSPYSSENPVFIGNGVFTGTIFPGNSRTSFVTKSPLGHIGWSNMGGFFASALKQAGLDAIMIKGKAKTPQYLEISSHSQEIKNADHLWGMTVKETAAQLELDSPLRSHEMIMIGPAGENRIKYSSIIGHGHINGKAAGRSGIGAVLGDKKVKAIVVEGTSDITVADPQRFIQLIDKMRTIFKNEPKIMSLRKYGTSELVKNLQKGESLVTRNFQEGVFSGAEKIGSQEIANNYFLKMQGCQSCYHLCTRYIYHKDQKTGAFAGKGPEYQNLTCLGSNLGIDSLPQILLLSDLVDELGMDVVSTGGTVGFILELFQRGLLTEEDTDGLVPTWGDYDSIRTIIERIAQRKGIGDILAEGTKFAAKKIGRGSNQYAMQSKGLEVSTGDPRGQFGFGLAYAVCSRGPDTMGALPRFEYLNDSKSAKKYFGSEEAGDRFGVHGKGALVFWKENLFAVYDSLNICKRLISETSSFDTIQSLSYPILTDIFNAATGFTITANDLERTGERINNLERLFNVRCGLRRKDDMLPKRFLKTKFDKGTAAGKTLPLDQMLDEYYKVRGWDYETGIPLPETLERVGLGEFTNDLP